MILTCCILNSILLLQYIFTLRVSGLVSVQCSLSLTFSHAMKSCWISYLALQIFLLLCNFNLCQIKCHMFYNIYILNWFCLGLKMHLTLLFLSFKMLTITVKRGEVLFPLIQRNNIDITVWQFYENVFFISATKILQGKGIVFAFEMSSLNIFVMSCKSTVYFRTNV